MKRVQFIVLLLISLAALAMSIVSLHKAAKVKKRARKWRSECMDLARKGQRYTGLMRLSMIVANSIRNEKGTGIIDKATHLRNLIYHGVPLKQTPGKFDFLSVDTAYLDSLRNDSVGHICGGLTIIYIAALESQGIPARYVGLFSSNSEPFYSHATVEFWYDGRWIASDPTFNIMFKSGDRYLSYSELYKLTRAGKDYEVTTNGTH